MSIPRAAIVCGSVIRHVPRAGDGQGAVVRQRDGDVGPTLPGIVLGAAPFRQGGVIGLVQRPLQRIDTGQADLPLFVLGQLRSWVSSKSKDAVRAELPRGAPPWGRRKRPL